MSVGTDDDEADEPDTVVTVTLADGADHDLGAPSEATVTVRDDDLPELTIADAAPVPEGGTLEFVLSLTSPAAAEFPVTWQIFGATAGVDYEGPRVGVLTFPPGVTEQTFRVVTVDDSDYGPEKTITVDLIDPSLAPFPQAQPGSKGEATGRILDDELPLVTVAADTATVTEGAAAAFTLTRTGYLPAALDGVLRGDGR